MATQTAHQDDRAAYGGAENPTSSITALVSQLFGGYKRQWHVTRDLARLEFKLSVRSIGFIVGFACLAIVLIGFTWLGLMSALVYAFWLMGTPFWALLLGFILIQIGCLLWLGTTVKQLAQEVGFRRSMSAMSQSMHPLKE